jgi:tetraacyldisaccharide 4'-kinase
MKAPAFWSGPPGPLAWLLAPLGFLYGRATAWRMNRPGARAGLPVICVGNVTAGGAGKTPVVAMLAEQLLASGETPFVVSRGYGGRLAGPVRVDPAAMTAAECGDEPLLLARRCPVIVARDRVAGAALARQQGASLVILDDGLQNPGLAKDICLVAVDAEAGFGNGFCLPAGPLRAPVSAQMPKVDAALVIGGAASAAACASGLQPWGKPVFQAVIRPDPAAVEALRGRPLLAFAGIGRPEKFFATLREAALEVAQTRAFADHHPYTSADIEALRRLAAARGLTLVTTEKDAMRLPPGVADITMLPVSLSVSGEALFALLAEAIARRRSAP